MKRKYLYLIVIVSMVMLTKGNAQNLVPNPSFEDTIMCPTMGGQVTAARYWYAAEETPDYYNACSITWQLSVPLNYFGYQYAHTGDAYMGLWDYEDWTFARETIGAYLTAPLIIGQKYYVNFKTCLAIRLTYADNTATNGIGMLFSTNIAYSTRHNNFAQVITYSIITDTTNWTTIKGSFIADSAYTFISVSNFLDDAHTDTIHFQDSAHTNMSYYYIDDLCVSADSLYCEVWTGLPKEVLKGNIIIYPNPSEKQITIENISYDCKLIEIYDMLGGLVKSIEPNRSYNITLDISSFHDGIYSLIFRKQNTIEIKKIIKMK